MAPSSYFLRPRRKSGKRHRAQRVLRIFAIQASGAQYRVVGHTEQHYAVSPRAVYVPMPDPIRHAEDILRRPAHLLVAAKGRTLAFDDVVDGARGAAPSFALECGPQHADVARQGGHGRSAGGRVDVLEREPIVWAAFGISELVERGDDLLPRVAVREVLANTLFPSRPQVAGAPQSEIGATRAPRLRFFAVGLEKWLVEPHAERNVEHIEPDAVDVGVIVMVVPGIARRQDEVVGLHCQRLAVDYRVELRVAGDREAHRRHGMAVC